MTAVPGQDSARVSGAMGCTVSCLGSPGEAFVLGLSEELINAQHILQGLALSTLAQQLSDPQLLSVHCVLLHPEQSATTGPRRTQGLKEASPRRTCAAGWDGYLSRLLTLDSAVEQGAVGRSQRWGGKWALLSHWMT